MIKSHELNHYVRTLILDAVSFVNIVKNVDNT